MKEVNQVPSSVSETTTYESPFEIVIRRKNPEHIAPGESAELVFPCEGFVAHLYLGDHEGTRTLVQGEYNANGVARGILGCPSSKKIVSAMSAIMLADMLVGTAKNRDRRVSTCP